MWQADIKALDPDRQLLYLPATRKIVKTSELSMFWFTHP